MKEFRRYFLLFLTLILVLSLTVACGSQKFSSDDSMTEVSEDSIDFGANEESKYEEEGESPLEPEKVITTIYMDFETTEFDKSSEFLYENIKKYGAYVENSNIDYTRFNNNKRYKNAYYLIRVPKDKVLDFKLGLNGVGNILSENTNKEDVTKQYKDTKSRLKVIETKEERILSLLSKAEKIEDIIKLESELSEIIYEKEQLKTNLMNIDDKVDFSTFEIHIREVDRLSNEDTIDTKFGTKIKNAFNNSMYMFKIVIEKLIIYIVYILPFAVIIGIIYYIIRKFKKKKPPKVD
ncbi:MAG: DUF4349 domain-containing protein [Tissierellia bacterium]|nr:DUF4349 domain-containing protein [Tissierellia bacterium]